MSELVSRLYDTDPAVLPAPIVTSKDGVPVDEFGMPYLIHPYDPPRGSSRRWDDDHSFFFSNSTELRDKAGKALRCSRVQYVPRWLHDRKHKMYGGGVEQLPTDSEDKFALTVLACAGYASRHALDLRGYEPRLTWMSRDTYEFVKGKKRLYTEHRSNSALGYRTADRSIKRIGVFFANYIRTHGFDDVIDDTVVDEFLYSKNQERQQKLGNKIIGHATLVVVDPIKPIYVEALRAGSLRHGLDHPFKAVERMFPRQLWPDYHDALRQDLLLA
ncbi:hypothetical protein KC867_02855 [Candidatus Saccharibacteria bacterium]|nr:hypothetical protein [Candidatus Saccharibacteria bacterium]